MKYLIYMALILLVPVGPLAAIDFSSDWGPLFSRDRTPADEARCRALGPFWETRQAEDGGNLLALRPVFSREHDVYQRRTVKDVMWPIWSGKLRYDRSSQWRCLLLMTWRNDDIDDPSSRYAFQILPVYFQGRADDGDSYIAVFPLGGRIRNFLFYDEVRFVLFPLYSKASVNDLTTTSWVWPLGSRTVGGDTERHSFFPFYGYSRRRDEFEKRFILWPFWTSVRYNYAGAAGSGYVFFPFWGHVRLEDQESWMVFPPFFRVSRGARLQQTHAPWPFIQISRGEVEKTYFWPLWGEKSGQGFRQDFLIWPICMRFRQFSLRDNRERFWVLPFAYFTDAKTSLPDQPAHRQTGKIWPFYSSLREDDVSILRVPSLMPFRDFPVIDRNFAPLWTLYTRESSANATQQELLWGTVRYRRQDDGARYFSFFPLAQYDNRPRQNSLEWNCLKGLFGYTRKGGRRRLRLLYFMSVSLGRQGGDVPGVPD